MSYKPLTELLTACSVLPALIIMPAFAKEITTDNPPITEPHTYTDDGRVFVVRPTGTLTFTGGVTFDGNNALDGSAILNQGKLNIQNGLTVKGNEVTNTGALVNSGVADIRGNVSFLSNNITTGGGGALYNGATGVLTLDAGDGMALFDDNTGVNGAALHNQGDATLSGAKLTFSNNKSHRGTAGYGGTIYNNGQQNTHLKLYGRVNEFSNNTDQDIRKLTQSGGGAIHNRGQNGKEALITVGDASTTLNHFIKNTAAINGGAIVNRNRSDIEFNGHTWFSDNSANTGHGGAIYNFGLTDDTGAESATLTFNDSAQFDNNKSLMGNGGALWNGTDDERLATAKTVFHSTAHFSGNSAKQNGGAIYNTGTVFFEDTVNITGNRAGGYGGAIMNDTGGKLYINGGSIYGNSADETNEGDGGAIFSRGTLTISNTKFWDNTAAYDGAIGTGVTSDGLLTLNNVEFRTNKALSTGALGLFKNAVLNDVKFIGNEATSATEEGGGAMYLGAESKTIASNLVFQGNKSESDGGGLMMRPVSSGNNVAASLDLTGAEFVGNTAKKNGGALYNTLHNSKTQNGYTYVALASFTNNHADKQGGAVYNSAAGTQDPVGGRLYLSDATFIGNTAAAGGAVYNDTGAKIVFAGQNAFLYNKAAGVANDIHNMGTVEIVAGKTTIGGGVSGSGTLAVADGAQLDIGTTLIQQGRLDIDGTVYARIDAKDNDSYGRLYADAFNIGDNARLILDDARVGTYKIFNRYADITIDAGFLYLTQNNGADGIVISPRTAEQIAADTGLSVQASAISVAMAGSSNHQFVQHYKQMVAEIQNNDDGLFRDNVEYYNQQAARAHPYDRPVLHSMTAAVNNQVTDLVIGRMGLGRAGGDMNIGYGAWVQGMHNTAKYSSSFDASTGGIAFGLDALIDRKYTLGVGFAKNTSDVDANNRDMEIDANTLFAYAQYKPNKWFANAMLSYSMADYEEETTLFGIPLHADYDVDSFSAQMMTGYDFATGLTPSVGVRYLHMTQDDYSNGLLNISGADSDFLTGVAGLRYAFDIQSDTRVKWSPEFHAGATYDFISDDVYSTVVIPGVANYRVRGDRLSRMGGEFGLGLSARYNMLTVSLNYELDLHRDYTSQSGLLKLKYNF